MRVIEAENKNAKVHTICKQKRTQEEAEMDNSEANQDKTKYISIQTNDHAECKMPEGTGATKLRFIMVK